MEYGDAAPVVPLHHSEPDTSKSDDDSPEKDIIQAIKNDEDPTLEAHELARLREQDALAVARAKAVADDEQEDEPQPTQEEATEPTPDRSQSPFKHQLLGTSGDEIGPRNELDAMLAEAAGKTSAAQEAVQYEPLRGQWHFGQAVLGRYKKTPYFYSGNIATYLGAGLFMIVFDDGSLNYRVKREDIVIRPQSSLPSSSFNDDEDDDGEEDGSHQRGESKTSEQQQQQRVTWYRTDVFLSDKPVMVDFSVSPPRQNSLGRVGYEVPEDAWLDVKHLECGVAYEDDSTQVSDSDDSSEEDMTMTPWQQMTQTFGMGGGGNGHRHPRQRASMRRSSISSLSQIDRLSMTGKSMNQILPSPKSIKQTIQDYLAKKTKKVQPSTVSTDPVSEVIHKMELRREQLMNGDGGIAPTRAVGLTRRESYNDASQTLTLRRQRSRSSTSSFMSGPMMSNGSGGRERSVSTVSFTVTTIGSPVSNPSSLATTVVGSDAPSISRSPPGSSQRVVFQRESNGVRAYGTVMACLPNGDYEVVTENDQTIVVQVYPAKDLDFLPSITELDAQIQDLQSQQVKLYAGRKVQVNLYPGTRFSGPGVITLVDDNSHVPHDHALQAAASGRMYQVLLQNRIRLINVPEDKIVPLKEKKKEPPRITEDQYLICQGKTKVSIGDQVFVKCEGEFEGQMDEKLGVLNGVYSNKTAAIDFADGSTGYEISPALISKRKRVSQSGDMELLSLKNAVLMQAAARHDTFQVDVGYQVKADHPRRASVESCVVIRKHSSSACDVRFADGTISFGVFPSQMIIDTHAIDSGRDKPSLYYQASVGEAILAWSSRFMRYCSAKVVARRSDGMYAIVFDYGESKDQVPAERIASIDDPDALSPTQKLTNYTFDTIGFEIQPVVFSVGEAVLARVHGSTRYYNGWVESVRDTNRTCAVVFDSSERDDAVKFSAMFSVDARNRFRSLGQPTCSGSSSGTGTRVDDNASDVSGASPAKNRRRHSANSVGSMIMSVAGSILQARRRTERMERRASNLVTEVGARKLRSVEDNAPPH